MNVTNGSDTTFEHELLRIRSAYDRRQSVPPGKYSPQNAAARLCVEERRRHTLALLRGAALDISQAIILDVGCGTGDWTRDFIGFGARPANIVAIDLLQDRIDVAKRLTTPGVTWECGSAHRLRFQAASFDLVLQSTVFSSILDLTMRRQIATEMLRVLRPGGFVLWYDFFPNNPANPDVRGLRKAAIRGLFPSCRILWRRITLAPPIARIVGPMWAPMYRFLSASKILCTHHLALIEKPR